MEIGRTGIIQNQVITPQVKAEKKDTEPKEQVELGTSQTEPDFLMKKPEMSEKESKEIATAVLAMGSGTIGALRGYFWGIVGLGALLVGGLPGVAVAATAGAAVGAYNALKPWDPIGYKGYFGMKEPSAGEKIFNAIYKGATNAASAVLGGTLGLIGSNYLAPALTGIPDAIKTAVKVSHWGEKKEQAQNTNK